MVFLEIISRTEVTMVLSSLTNFSWIPEKEEKHFDSENIEDFRKVQRQNYSKIAKFSFKSFSSKK